MNYLFKKLTLSIESHDNVIIMTHKHPDLDGMSSAICLYEVVKRFKKEVFVVFPKDDINNSLKKGLQLLKDNEVNVSFIGYPEVMKYVRDNTLLVVLDTQKSNLVLYEELLDIKDIFVIDHHINSSIHIKNTMFEYIDSNKSSIVEIMVEYLKYLDVCINPFVATLMLTGMDIDTHSYSLKTTDKTFMAASVLVKMGADNVLKREILKESMDDVVRRHDYIKESYFIKDGFVLCDMGEAHDVVDLAILADELLRLDGVQASFSVGKLKSGNVFVCARSMGKVSVDVIMSALGGGGHVTDAACEFSDKTNIEVISMIKDIVMEG